MRGNCLQTDWDELEEAEQLLQTGKEPSPEAAPTHTHGAPDSVGKPARESSSPSSQEETAPRVSHMAEETGKSLGKQLQQRLREADDTFHQVARLDGHRNFHGIFKTTSVLPLFHTQYSPSSRCSPYRPT